MINVVAAIIEDKEGKILITQRNFNKSQGGLWEFPGGKVEKNETIENAIIREIKEELNIDISVDKYLDEKIYNDPNKDINLIALKCSIVDGKIKLIEHEATKQVFVNDVMNNKIASIIEQLYRLKVGQNINPREKDAWKNSMMYMNNVLNDSSVPNNSGVAIEFKIPYTSKRIDFIITGRDKQKSR